MPAAISLEKVLIANRGEIAIRIIRACRELGIANVVIFSDVDAGATHVRMADEAYCIGEAPASKSYLRGAEIIRIARECGADAIHPGYGFLAENWEFAEAVAKAKLTFIGPPAGAIKLLGDKLAARRLMQDTGISVIPGDAVVGASLETARIVASKCKYPVLVKAVAGGGGKGMRLVRSEPELESALKTAAREALNAFGDERVYIEKYIEKPRHIEIQIARDIFGNAVYLGERECSIQRRHQKLIEEAPSVLVDQDMRRRMGEVAIKCITAAEYTNIGTVEFLVDSSRNFYFLEVNTRLQVEHPVTELITGVDLVKEQLSLAAGNQLSFKQNDIKLSGCAIECRICAEDPANGFLPSVGRLLSYREPAGPGVRVDSGIREGEEITPYYDSLVSKLITFGANRKEAVERMKLALSEYRICGVATNIAFYEAVMSHSAFQRGDLSTDFIEEHFPNGFAVQSIPKDTATAVAVAAALYNYFDARRIKQISTTAEKSTWLDNARQYGTNRLRGGNW